MASPASTGSARLHESKQPLSEEELRKMHSYWRAANYLSVGQIYLYANPLLQEPLKIEHIKPRLLGHWGTTPGLNFIYVHVNRLIKKQDLNIIYVIGPGHGGPGLVANAYLEGTYSELYPNITHTEEGLQQAKSDATHTQPTRRFGRHSESSNDPSRCENDDHEHDRRLQEFGHSRTDPRDDPHYANGSKHETCPEDDREVEHAGFQNLHSFACRG